MFFDSVWWMDEENEWARCDTAVCWIKSQNDVEALWSSIFSLSTLFAFLVLLFTVSAAAASLCIWVMILSLVSFSGTDSKFWMLHFIIKSAQCNSAHFILNMTPTVVVNCAQNCFTEPGIWTLQSKGEGRDSDRTGRGQETTLSTTVRRCCVLWCSSFPFSLVCEVQLLLLTETCGGSWAVF